MLTALHHLPAGEVWPLEEVARRRAEIESRPGLRWSVVESIPVHEDIKAGKGECERSEIERK